MKRMRFFLTVMLCSCSVIGFGLVGCGDDDAGDNGGNGGNDDDGGCDGSGIANRADCEFGCEVLVDCGLYQGTVNECTDECEGWSNGSRGCLCSLCDPNDACGIFSACVDACSNPLPLVSTVGPDRCVDRFGH